MYTVRVFQDGTDDHTDYQVDALTELGARVKAFLLDGGGMCPDAKGLVALAVTWTAVRNVIVFGYDPLRQGIVALWQGERLFFPDREHPAKRREEVIQGLMDVGEFIPRRSFPFGEHGRRIFEAHYNVPYSDQAWNDLKEVA